MDELSIEAKHIPSFPLAILFAVISILVGVLVMFGAEKQITDPNDRYLASIILSLLTHHVIFYLAWNFSRAAEARWIKDLNTRVVNLLRIHNDYFLDNRLHEILEEIVKCRAATEPNGGGFETASREIMSMVRKIIQDIGKPSIEQYDRDQEIYRMIRLKEAVVAARRKVLAVTAGDTYRDNFWEGEFPHAYLKAHQEAITRGVEIARIVVIERELLRSKTEQLPGIISKMADWKSKVPEMHLRVVWDDQVPVDLRGRQISMFTCDSVVASEPASRDSEGNWIAGYVALRSDEKTRDLEKRFNALEFASISWDEFHDLSFRNLREPLRFNAVPITGEQ